MERWAGRVAVVTGASSGIGEAIAKELTKHGMKVAALARRVERLQKLEEECHTYKGLLRFYHCDVTNDEEVATTVKSVVEDLGPISILVNNAALLSLMPLSDTNKGSPRKIYETNVIGLVNMTQHVGEVMKKHNINDGHIVNINSIVGHFVQPSVGENANYTASKCAVTMLSENLRTEMANLKLKTRVTSISPGFVKTDMSKPFGHFLAPEVQPLTPEDVVECLTFTLSIKPHIDVTELTVRGTGERFVFPTMK